MKNSYSKNKNLEKALFSAKDFIACMNFDRKDLPRKYVLIYQKTPLNYLKKKYKGSLTVRKIHEDIKIYQIGSIGVVKLDGIGAPNAVAILEELIALGGRHFLNLGSAGGLKRLGIFVCDKAIRGEGTSSHYMPRGKYSYPDRRLTEKLAESLKKEGLDYEMAPVWTTDAVYRETKTKISQYRREGVAAVDMEASALFVVAMVKKVKMAAAFAAGDLLGEKWTPQFNEMTHKKALNKLVNAGIECLMGSRSENA